MDPSLSTGLLFAPRPRASSTALRLLVRSQVELSVKELTSYRYTFSIDNYLG